ncbi:hypothetical protein BKA58DRAFT_394242 [Alternaria rosae]|uniref:uncharacterized protein n=1 Tax=Alternaria rosae TaxID=1187941 RepID=UPI001E8D36A2|nr:uncharacterized protein BKA58DRAFT_394242 [Alternaria rosae]KAH6852805.1 hypothetical protein BKA58DRAFT_394242 [Alternaria rosae]
MSGPPKRKGRLPSDIPSQQQRRGPPATPHDAHAHPPDPSASIDSLGLLSPQQCPPRSSKLSREACPSARDGRTERKREKAYKMKDTAQFIKDTHHAYQAVHDCLYNVYHLPLLARKRWIRVRSSPAQPRWKDDHELEQPWDGIHDRRDSTENSRIAPNALTFGAMFVFSYGIDILADLTFSAVATGINIATRPLAESDFETEEFHFEYNPEIQRDHMIKLAMSHAIAQSTKLTLTGKLGMRTDVVKMIGQLFTSPSNMLDTPSFFWDSEPTLHPLTPPSASLLRFSILQKGRKRSCGWRFWNQAVGGLKGMGPPAYAGPGLLAARSLVWFGSGVKSLLVG